MNRDSVAGEIQNMTDELDRYDEAAPPSALAGFLYPQPAERSAGGILRWWESRRIPFNLVVGGSGALSIAAISLAASLPPNAPGFTFFWVPVVAYGVLANICFTFGSVVELILEKLWGRDVLPAGPALWRMGLTFSVGLTLGLPLIMIVIGWVFRVVGWLV